MRKITNSAGRSGATPTRQTSRPLSRSFWVIVERSHFTKYAFSGLSPSSAPICHSFKRKSSTVRRTIEDFLFDQWQKGALLGDKPEKAFFVKCDRSTMTQNDLDNGRLVCLIGVAALRPAEFVIFQIGQWTADRRG